MAGSEAAITWVFFCCCEACRIRPRKKASILTDTVLYILVKIDITGPVRAACPEMVVFQDVLRKTRANRPKEMQETHTSRLTYQRKLADQSLHGALDLVDPAAFN